MTSQSLVSRGVPNLTSNSPTALLEFWVQKGIEERAEQERKYDTQRS